MASKKLLIASILTGLVLAGNAWAAGNYDAGATDTVIKIGNTSPYSGPASSYGTIGKAVSAYFNKINSEGGINGRRIEFISLDDAYSPPKTKEQFRKLVEREKVLLIFQSLGTPTNSAVHRYMNKKQVPHLFLSTGAAKWGQPKEFPWTMGWQPNYQTEGMIYAQIILRNRPNGKIAVLFQNDDYGKDYVTGLKQGLGDRAASMIVAEESYETADPTIDSQIIKLKNSGADVLFNVTIPKFAAQAIRKVDDLGWKPFHLLNSVANSVGAVMRPAGFDKVQGMVSAIFAIDPTDEAYQHTQGYKSWHAWMKEYYPDGDLKDAFNVNGYLMAQTMVHVLENAGDNLTHENIMKTAANIKDLQLSMMLPGVMINTAPDDFYPIEAMQPVIFSGESWEPMGEVVRTD